MDADLPLVKTTEYPRNYAPELLCPVPRALAREPIGIALAQPFSGCDIWNAWELTWLKPSGLPEAAIARITVAADSDNLIESKSLKLYLNSLAMSRFDSVAAVTDTINADLRATAKGNVQVQISALADVQGQSAARLPGKCLDALDVQCNSWDTDPEQLQADAHREVSEAFYSHLLRSQCPVTGQPDSGSLHIRYQGPEIDAAGLLRYIVSYRQHEDFHEACVERMFVDILQRCKPRELSIGAYFQRRGGIDINPFRSNVEHAPALTRLWQQ